MNITLNAQPCGGRLQGIRMVARLAVALSLAILPATPSRAKIYTWSSASSGAWSDASHWSPTGGPPGVGDTAFFTGANYTVSGNGTASLLDVNANELTLTGKINATSVPPAPTVAVGHTAFGKLVLDGAELQSNRWIIVGYEDIGVVSLKHATLSPTWEPAVSAASFIGFGANGFVDIDGTSRFDNNGPMTLGGAHTGVIDIAPGGILTSSGSGSDAGAILGYNEMVRGTVNLRGAGALWSNQGQINIGSAGFGDVTMDNGAWLTSGGDNGSNPGILLGFGPKSNGELTMRGADSLLESDGQMTIGSGGVGTFRMFGGTATSSTKTDQEAAFLGVSPGSMGSAAVDGGSGNTPVWTITPSLTVGGRGVGELTIAGGGRVEVNDSEHAKSVVTVAGAKSAKPSSISIIGEESVLEAPHAQVIVGGEGQGILDVSFGAVNARQIIAGHLPGATEAEPSRVDIAGGAITLAEDFQLGQGGPAASELTAGGKLTSQSGTLGGFASFSDGRLSRGVGRMSIGADSVWEIKPDPKDTQPKGLVIGELGRGYLTIFNGGTVKLNGDAARIVVGQQPGSHGEL